MTVFLPRERLSEKEIMLDYVKVKVFFSLGNDEKLIAVRLLLFKLVKVHHS